MTLEHAALFWVAAFANTFVLGFQSRNVNSGRYISAAVTSSTTAIFQLLVWRAAVSDDLALALPIYMTSGPSGIVAAMWVSHRMFERGRKPSQAAVGDEILADRERDLAIERPAAGLVVRAECDAG